MQRIGYTKGPSTSELKDYDKIFDGNLTASNIEALDALFLDGGKGSSRHAATKAAAKTQGHLLDWLFSIYVISTKRDFFWQDSPATTVLDRPPSTLDGSLLFIGSNSFS
jgi:hypothetical protein